MNDKSVRFLLMTVLLACVLPAAFAQRNLNVEPEAASEQRVALVIGNASYKVSPLRNPVNDATDVAGALKGLGFHVVLRTNANRRQMVEAVREFGNLIKRGGVGFFYYAGHGIQSRGRNYLGERDPSAQSDQADARRAGEPAGRCGAKRPVRDPVPQPEASS